MIATNSNSSGNSFYKFPFIICFSLLFGLLTYLFLTTLVYPAAPRQDIVFLQKQVQNLANGRVSPYSAQLTEADRSRLESLDFSGSVSEVWSSSRFGYTFLVVLADGDKCIFDFDYYSQKFQRQYDLDVSCSGW